MGGYFSLAGLCALCVRLLFPLCLMKYEILAKCLFEEKKRFIEKPVRLYIPNSNSINKITYW
jgi:hypothetical protein